MALALKSRRVAISIELSTSEKGLSTSFPYQSRCVFFSKVAESGIGGYHLFVGLPVGQAPWCSCDAQQARSVERGQK